jgi:ammonium transporter, Amt family
MQVAFALIESAQVAAINSKCVILKNTLDNAFGALAWLLIGYAVSGGSRFEGNAFSGNAWDESFSIHNKAYEKSGPAEETIWVFYYGFASSAATIVSGAMCERTHLRSHLIFAFFMAAVIYPFAHNWMWGGGWLGASKGSPCL